MISKIRATTEVLGLNERAKLHALGETLGPGCELCLGPQ